MTALARLVLLAILAAVGAPAGAQLFGAPDLLEPEKAFRISARALDERSIEVEFRIARGYYLYRHRFSFATQGGKPIQDAQIPRGVIHEDQFFGRQETFRDRVRIRVPVPAHEAAKGTVTLIVGSQGCADRGVCYVPVEQTVRVTLPGRR